MPVRPRPERTRLPGRREPVKEDLRGIGDGSRGPHLVLLARDATGYRSLCRLISRANLAGTKGVPRFSQALLADHAEGLVALSGCRDGELARRLRVGDRAGARLVAEGYARLFGGSGSNGHDPNGRGGRSRRGGAVAAGFVLELQHHLLPEDDWLVAETARLADELGLPCVVTNDVHYARPEGRELQDVLGAIRHGRTLDTLADLRRPDGESYLKSEAELLGLPPAAAHDDGGHGRRTAQDDGPAHGDGRPTTTGGPPGPGSPDWLRRPRLPPPAPWISDSSATASPASRCRAGRPRSATWPSCAMPAPDGATTRSRRPCSASSATSSR